MKHYIAAISGFVIWGTFALVLRPLSGFNAFDILAHRIMYATVCIIIACFLFRKKESKASIQYMKSLPSKAKKKLLLNVVLSAALLTMNWFSYIFVMNKVSVNATALAYLICPILTTFFASILLKEKLNKGQWFAVGLSLVSCVILASGHFLDLFYSVFIASTYAFYLILQKRNTQLDKFFTLTIHITCCLLFLLPVLYFMQDATPKPMVFHSYILIIALFYTIIPLFLNMYALKKLDSSIVGSLLYLNPIIAFLLAIFYFKEAVSVNQIIGFALVFLAVIVFNIAYFYQLKMKNKEIGEA